MPGQCSFSLNQQPGPDCHLCLVHKHLVTEPRGSWLTADPGVLEMRAPHPPFSPWLKCPVFTQGIDMQLLAQPLKTQPCRMVLFLLAGRQGSFWESSIHSMEECQLARSEKGRKGDGGRLGARVRPKCLGITWM